MRFQAILQVTQNIAVRIDDGNVIRLLTREVICRCTTDLTGAQNDDFHSGLLYYEAL
jgi:hypothetical protein